MAVVDVLIVLAFAAYAISSGLRSRRVASRDLEQYFLAGRSLTGWTAGISMAATQFAADTPLLVTGLIATAGIFSLWQLWIYALAFLLLGFLLAPSWRRAGVLTDAALAEIRYGGRPAAILRGTKAVYFGTVFNCTVLAMVLFAAKEIAEPFLLWNEWLPVGVFEPVETAVRAVGVPIARSGGDLQDVWVRSANNLISILMLVGVTTLYSTTGGLRSVVRTDLAQFAVMMLATAAYAVWVVQSAGGMESVVAEIRTRFGEGGPGGIRPDEILAFTPSRARDASFVVLAVFALQWLVQMNADGTGYLAQRSMACRSDDDARRASLVFAVAQVLLRSLLWLPIGLSLLVLFPPDLELGLEVLRADREATFVRGIQMLPPGLLGLMLTAMLAALASTIDTHLNWGSSYWTHDIYDRFVCRALLGREPSGRSTQPPLRLQLCVLQGVALLVMTQLSSIQTAWKTSLLLGAGMGVILVLRWIWWRITAAGEIASIATASLLAPLLLVLVPDEHEALRLLVMALGATGVGIATSLVLAPEARERLVDFYQRARPPGFWGPIAVQLGEDPATGARRLWRGLGAAGLCALSIFCALTGLGSWMVGSAPPLWFPWRGLWIALLLALSLALIPVWLRLGFGGEQRRQPAAAGLD